MERAPNETVRFKFRRQHDLGRYVADFFCFEAGLAIEVEALAHDLGDNPERDTHRDQWLSGRGIKTLRFSAVAVRDDLEAVTVAIIDACRLRSAV